MAKKAKANKASEKGAEETEEAAAGNGGDDAQAATDEGPPPLVIGAQYIKDLSFEAPTTPGIFGMMQQQAPDINININVNAQPMQDNTYEVVLQINADCKVGETVAFIMEVSYAGLFEINVPEESLQPMLLIECPRLLFPFVRYILADTTRDGGFPPLMLGPVDFTAMFQDELRKQADTASGDTAAAGDGAS